MERRVWHAKQNVRDEVAARRTAEAKRDVLLTEIATLEGSLQRVDKERQAVTVKRNRVWADVVDSQRQVQLLMGKLTDNEQKLEYVKQLLVRTMGDDVSVTPVVGDEGTECIITFVEYSTKLIAGSCEIFKSANGTSADHAQISVILNDLSDVAQALTEDNPHLTTAGPHHAALKKLAGECATVAAELKELLENLKRKEGNKVWRSLEATWKTMRKEKQVQSIEQRLNGFRLELLLRLSQMMNDEHITVNSRLDQIKQQGLVFSTQSTDMLRSVQHDVQTLETKLTSQLSESLKNNSEGTQTSLEEVASMLQLINSKLDAVPGETPAQSFILRRLYFPEMHSRLDSIVDTEFGTFEWLLEDDESSGSEAIGDGDSSNESDDSESTESDESDADARCRFQCEVRCKFLEWIDTGRSVYHISGKAGSGKSTLMKFLARDPRLEKRLHSWAGEKKLVFASIFFWSSGATEQRSLEGLYRSILFEVVRQCPELLHDVIPEKTLRDMDGLGGIPLRLSELKQAMDLLASKEYYPRHRFAFLIDGLDEFEANLTTDHWDLAQTLLRWAAKCDDIKLCVSSRPHEEFLQTFDPTLRMHLHEVTFWDIRRFVKGMFAQNCPGLDLESAETNQLLNDIIKRADGVFLWVRLVVKSILDAMRHRASLKQLQEKLDSLPRGLTPLFDKMFDDIDPSDKRRSDKILLIFGQDPEDHYSGTGSSNALQVSWLDDLEDPEFPFNVTQRPYTDAEIRDRQEAVRGQLRSLAKGLLELRAQSSGGLYFHLRVQLFHRSVAEYLADPSLQATMKQRLGATFSLRQSQQRLRLAEFKFAPKTKESLSQAYGHKHTLAARITVNTTEAGIAIPDYNFHSLSALGTCFYGVLHFGQEDIMESDWDIPEKERRQSSFKILNELESALEHHRQTPLPQWQPKDIVNVDDQLPWGTEMNPAGSQKQQHYAILFRKDISFLHHIIQFSYGETAVHDFIMRHVREDRSLLLPTQRGESLLLTAAIDQQSALVHDLLAAGAEPEAKMLVRHWQAGTVFLDSYLTKSESTVWAVFLMMFVEAFTCAGDDLIHESGCRASLNPYFLIMQYFLEFGATSTVYFLFKAPRHGCSSLADEEPGGTQQSRTQAASLEPPAWSLNQDDHGIPRNVVKVQLQDIIFFVRPPNMATLLRHIAHKNDSWIWEAAKEKVTALLPSLAIGVLQPRTQAVPPVRIVSPESTLRVKLRLPLNLRSVHVGDSEHDGRVIVPLT